MCRKNIATRDSSSNKNIQSHISEKLGKINLNNNLEEKKDFIRENEISEIHSNDPISDNVIYEKYNTLNEL